MFINCIALVTTGENLDTYVNEIEGALRENRLALTHFQRLKAQCRLLPFLLFGLLHTDAVSERRALARAAKQRSKHLREDSWAKVSASAENRALLSRVEPTGITWSQFARDVWEVQAERLSNSSRLLRSSVPAASRSNTLLIYWTIGHVWKMTGQKHYEELAEILGALGIRCVTGDALCHLFNRFERRVNSDCKLAIMQPQSSYEYLAEIKRQKKSLRELEKLSDEAKNERMAKFAEEDAALTDEQFDERIAKEVELTIEHFVAQLFDYLRIPAMYKRTRRARILASGGA